MPFSLKRTLLPLALAAAALATSARADTYPSRQITIMPLLAAGTGLDVVVRLYADRLSQSFGKPVVVENKPGSAGLVGRLYADRRDQRGDGDPPDSAQEHAL
jgi:tripartite-type tricarboxylate transporter receptor subunit TctC